MSDNEPFNPISGRRNVSETGNSPQHKVERVPMAEPPISRRKVEFNESPTFSVEVGIGNNNIPSESYAVIIEGIGKQITAKLPDNVNLDRVAQMAVMSNALSAHVSSVISKEGIIIPEDMETQIIKMDSDVISVTKNLTSIPIVAKHTFGTNKNNRLEYRAIIQNQQVIDSNTLIAVESAGATMLRQIVEALNEQGNQ